MSVNIKPSWVVRETSVYLEWCNVCVCKECGTRGQRIDFHPANPCIVCGSRSKDELVGRWIKPEYKWTFFKRKEIRAGRWELRNEQD